jgi:hypothetical protein
MNFEENNDRKIPRKSKFLNKNKKKKDYYDDEDMIKHHLKKEIKKIKQDYEDEEWENWDQYYNK